jgi:hypothetical protein
VLQEWTLKDKARKVRETEEGRNIVREHTPRGGHGWQRLCVSWLIVFLLKILVGLNGA